MTTDAPPVHRPLAYRPEIDGLRALAVLLVVLFHAGFGVPGGYVGVDVFFVISGFLITTLVRRELADGTFTLAGFYERRARRILPASLAMTLAVLAFGYLWLLPSDLEGLGLSTLWHACFAGNVYFYREATNYFGGGVANMPLLHTWSLGVEEQFYVAFPLLLIACRLAWRRRFYLLSGGLIAVLAAVGYAWADYSVPLYPLSGFFLLPARAWELLVGAGLAVLPAWRGPRVVREIASVVAVAAMLAPALLYSSTTLFPGRAALAPCLGAALFIWSCRGRFGTDAAADHAFRQTLLGRFFGSAGPVFVGKISYSLYLWHWPVFVFAGYWRLSPAGGLERAALVALSFVLAVLSWRFIETPLRRRQRVSVRRLLSTVAVGSVAVLGVAGVFKATHGVPKRYPEKVTKIDDVRREKRRMTQTQVAAVLHDRLTAFGLTDDGPPDLLLWGDSHAGVALSALDAVCRAHGVRGRAATRSSMAPLVDYAIDSAKAFRPSTIRYNRAVVDYVKRNKIRTVVLVSYWKRDIEFDPAALADGVGRTIGELRDAGATVYVMQQVPGYGLPVPKALAFEAVFGRELPGWRRTPADLRREQRVMLDLAAKYGSAEVHFIDPTPFFGDDGEGHFNVADKGRPLYMDNHHLTVRGAKRVLGPFFEQALFGEATTRPAARATTVPATTENARTENARTENAATDDAATDSGAAGR